MIEIVLGGAPRGKGRPRFRVIPGRSFVHTYTDSKTRAFEDRLRSAGQDAMEGQPILEGPLVLVLQALVPIPASWPKARKEAARRGDIRPITRPDLDNYVKCVDALNGVVWHDDSQIVSCNVGKFYADHPQLRIGVQMLLQPVGDFD